MQSFPARLCRRRASAALFGALAGVPLAAQPQPIRVVTEELPPYNMRRRGEVTGVCTEVVQETLRQAGVAAEIQVMPWARAYDIALNEENVLIYSILRTPQREKLFKWVGTIAPTRWVLYAHPDRKLRLRSLDDARKLQVATVNQDAGEQYLVARGFVVGQNLQSGSQYEKNYEKFKLGRVDLWISDELTARYIARQAGDDPAKLLAHGLPLPDLVEQGGMDMAFSLKTPDATVERFRAALQAVKKDGRYARIQKKWL